MSENDRETKKQKEDALKESRAGYDACEEKDFDAAIKHYSKAMELDDEDILYIIDRAAVYFEMRKYSECIDDCTRALERGHQLNSNVELIAKAWTRKGLAYMELVDCAKDYDLAIEALDIACILHEDQETAHKLDCATKAKEQLEQKERSADREMELGNNCHNNKQFEEAVKHYTEAIKLNPNDVKGYSNRAASYIMLERLAEGLKDANKTLELDPTFARGYSQKIKLQCMGQKYSQALETYKAGLEHVTDNKKLLHRDIKECLEQMPPQKKDPVMQANIMSDPEIRNILSDPIMRQVLIDLQQNSSDAGEHAKNSLVLEKLQKLSAAGLI